MTLHEKECLKEAEALLRSMVRYAPSGKDPGGWDKEAAEAQITTLVNTIKRLYGKVA